MELRKKLISVAALAFAMALSAGVAVSAGAEGEKQTDLAFAITGVSVRYDDPARDDDGSGIRFKVDVPETWTQNAVSDAYTIITLTPVSGDFAGQETYAKVSAQVWRDDTGWNTVLVNIPTDDYTTKVTAQAFATIGGVEYETETVSYSIAEAASLVMNDQNAIDDKLIGYVTNVESLTLDETAVNAAKGETVQLTANIAPAGYGVVYASDNETVATVDNTGKVTVHTIGGANVTATMGGKTATTKVTGTSETIENKVKPAFVDFVPSDKTQEYAWKAGASGATGDYSFRLMNGATANPQFYFDGAWLHSLFSDIKVEAFTYDFIASAAGDRQITSSGNLINTTYTNNTWTNVEFTRDMYNTWAASNEENFVFTWQNQSTQTGGTKTVSAYFDNFQVVLVDNRVIKDFNDQTYLSDYTALGNSEAIQSYYGSTNSSANITDGYSGLTTTVNMTRSCAPGELGSANGDYALNFELRNQNNEHAIGFAIAWLDEVFANDQVTAMTWTMMIKLGGSTGALTTVSPDVEQSWSGDVPTLGTWPTYTMTRADYEAIKQAQEDGALTVDGFLTIWIKKSTAAYGGTLTVRVDNITAIFG